MSDDLVAPRPQIARFAPYIPGRSLESVKREYGLSRVVKLASNENPLGPSPKAAAALRAAAGKVNLYPDGFSTALRETLAKSLRVRLTEVTVGAGSDELIEILGKAYLNPGDDIVVSEHAFLRYKMAGELMGARVIEVPMKNDTHDLEAMARAVTDRTKLVFIANPNNPTGTYNTHDEMEEFLITLPARVLAVIDEAYFEYARARPDYPDAIDFFRSGRNLIALRTFSKIHGLAGVRLGYGVAPEPVIATLERVRPPFNVSTPAQAAGIAALGDRGHVRRSAGLVAKEKALLEKALKGMGIPFFPSVGNFLLMDVSPRRGADVFEALMKKGVIVRAMNEYGYPHHIRVTVGKPAENRLFLKVFREVYPS
jgi:histidinol-phosphate aminotransferase